MDPIRIFIVYCIFLTICISFFIFGIKIILRNKDDRVNQFFSIFFFIIDVGLIINFIYVPISDNRLQELVNFLNRLTAFFICLGVFFLVFAIIYLDPSKEYSIKKTLLLFFLYLIPCLSLLLIPNAVNVYIPQNGTQCYPKWSFSFVSIFLSLILGSLLLTYYNVGNLYKKFSNPILIKKLRYFILGISMFYYVPITIGIANYLNILEIRLIFSIFYPIIIPGAILIYYGICISPKISD
ncbi:MAG: hypothetical protein ACP6IY_03965 [Promethearchaeia archaeon]